MEKKYNSQAWLLSVTPATPETKAKRVHVQGEFKASPDNLKRLSQKLKNNNNKGFEM